MSVCVSIIRVCACANGKEGHVCCCVCVCILCILLCCIWCLIKILHCPLCRRECGLCVWWCDWRHCLHFLYCGHHSAEDMSASSFHSEEIGECRSSSSKPHFCWYWKKCDCCSGCAPCPTHQPRCPAPLCAKCQHTVI